MHSGWALHKYAYAKNSVLRCTNKNTCASRRPLEVLCRTLACKREEAMEACGDPLGREPPQRHGWMSLFDQRRRNMGAQFKRCLLAGNLRRANDSRDRKNDKDVFQCISTVTSPVGVSGLAVGICVHHSTLRKLAGRAIVRCNACSLGDTFSPPSPSSSSSVSTRLRSAVSPAGQLAMCSARRAPYTSLSTTNRVMACEL
jgi:hypothetical protein